MDCCVYGCKPSHLQSQGAVERSNGDIKDMLLVWLADSDTHDCMVTGIKFVQFQKSFSSVSVPAPYSFSSFSVPEPSSFSSFSVPEPSSFSSFSVPAPSLSMGVYSVNLGVPEGTDIEKVTDISVTVIIEQTVYVDDQAVSSLSGGKSCATGRAKGEKKSGGL